MSRTIICADSLQWLRSQKKISNVVTGICDADEMDGYSVEEYMDFFVQIADQIFSKIDNQSYAIFIQTDRKWKGQWLDKSYVLTGLARKYGLKTMWHKIVLHRPVDSTHIQRPTYAHMLCYSHTNKPGEATPDVINGGKKLYKNATPLNAAVMALKFIKKSRGKGALVLDPFVGQGTIAAVGLSMGLHVTGIDIDPSQCDKAKKLVYKH
jgi:hypothetical protein